MCRQRSQIYSTQPSTKRFWQITFWSLFASSLYLSLLATSCSIEKDSVQKRTYGTSERDAGAVLNRAQNPAQKAEDKTAVESAQSRQEEVKTATESSTKDTADNPSSNNGPAKDQSPLTLSLISGPESLTNKNPITLEFTVNKNPVTFVCTLDKKTIPCSPVPSNEKSRFRLDLENLEDGPRELSVIATNDSGQSSQPLTAKFTVDRTLPSLLLADVFSSEIYVATTPYCIDIKWNSGSSDTKSFELSIDESKENLTADIIFKNHCFEAGPHSISLSATDETGNTSTPVKVTFDVKLRFSMVENTDGNYYVDKKNKMKITAPITVEPIPNTSNMETRYPCPTQYGGLSGWQPMNLEMLKGLYTEGFGKSNVNYPEDLLLGYTNTDTPTLNGPVPAPVGYTVVPMSTQALSMATGEGTVRYYKLTSIRQVSYSKTFFEYYIQKIACYVTESLNNNP